MSNKRIIVPSKKFYGVAPATGKAAGAGWTPASVTTSFWYDASNAASITKDGSNNVSQWNDLSGNARHLTGTGLFMPVWAPTIMNGLAGIHFIAFNDLTKNSYMTTGAFTVAFPYTVMLVFRSTNAFSGSNAVGASGQYGVILDGDRTQSGTRMLIFSGRGDVADFPCYYAGVTPVSTGLKIANTTNYHWVTLFGSTASSSSSNMNGTTTSATSPGTTGAIINGLTIGTAATNNMIDLYLCEIFCIPDTANVANAIAYVLAKWGV